jgi:WD40 repeat protein
LQTITLGHSNGVVSVWDGLSGQLIESWRAHDGPISQVLPITAQVCLTASHDRSLVLWNRSETVNFNNPSEHIPKQIKVFKGHRDPVLGCDLLGSDMLSIAGHRISCANLDSHESAIKLNRIKLHKTSTLKPNQLTTLTALPLHQLALVGTEDGLIKLCN